MTGVGQTSTIPQSVRAKGSSFGVFVWFKYNTSKTTCDILINCTSAVQKRGQSAEAEG